MLTTIWSKKFRRNFVATSLRYMVTNSCSMAASLNICKVKFFTARIIMIHIILHVQIGDIEAHVPCPSLMLIPIHQYNNRRQFALLPVQVRATVKFRLCRPSSDLHLCPALMDSLRERKNRCARWGFGRLVLCSSSYMYSQKLCALVRYSNSDTPLISSMCSRSLY